MDLEVFRQRLLAAAQDARAVAETFVIESLPEAMRFDVMLNASHDGDPEPHEVLYPSDSSIERTLTTQDLSAVQVVRLLWRDGRVPEWIDISVAGRSGDATVLQLLCCGRFTDHDERLYYTWNEGRAPFGVKSPTLPPGWKEGEKFSIHLRSRCCSLGALERTCERPERVSFLWLQGLAFSDEVLAALPPFPQTGMLSLCATPVAGPGLSWLSRLAALQKLCLERAQAHTLDLSSLPVLPAVDYCIVEVDSGRLRGVERLARALPELEGFTLASRALLDLDGALDLSRVRDLKLYTPRLPELVHTGPALHTLHVSAGEEDTSGVMRFLARCPARLRSLSVSDTPVTDRVLGALDRFRDLRDVSFHGTRVDPGTLATYAARRGIIVA